MSGSCIFDAILDPVFTKKTENEFVAMTSFGAKVLLWRSIPV